MELAIGVRRETKNIACGLKAESHVEVFRDLRLGPVLFVAVVRIDVCRRVLDGLPANDSIVTYKGADITVCHTKFEAGVNEIGEPSNTAE